MRSNSRITNATSSSSSSSSSSSHQAIPESTLIRVSCSKFDNKPLVPFDTCLTLIDGLLKFLFVFSTKDRAAKDKIDNILIKLVKIKTIYNELGGLFGMADTVWICLGETEYTQLLQTKLATKNPFIRIIFQIDAVNEFVHTQIQEKYKIYNSVEANAPFGLVSAVYQLIEFNSLPPAARQYGDIHYKDKVSAADLHLKTARGNIDTITEELVIRKGKTSKSNDINNAIKILTKEGSTIALAYDNFIRLQTELASKQQIASPTPSIVAKANEKIEVEQPKSLKCDEPKQNESDQDKSDQKDNIMEIKLFGSAYNPHIDTVSNSTLNPPVTPQIEQLKKVELHYDENFLKIAVESLAAYFFLGIIPLSKRALELGVIIQNIQMAIETEIPDQIDKAFSSLKNFVNQALSTVETVSIKHFKPQTVDAILKSNLINAGYVDKFNKLKDLPNQVKKNQP
jgi:hypothetical protein